MVAPALLRSRENILRRRQHFFIKGLTESLRGALPYRGGGYFILESYTHLCTVLC